MTGAAAFLLVSPILTLAATALLVLTVDFFLPKLGSRPALTFVAVAGCIVALYLVAGLWTGRVGPDRDLDGAVGVFGGAARVDKFGLLLSGVVVACAALTILSSMGYAERRRSESGEYYALILFAAVGMVLLASSTHLLTLVIALETLSISIYALVGILPAEERSSEGAMKYFVQGSFSSAFLLYGVALVYGGTGTLSLEGVAAVLSTGSQNGILFLAGVALSLVGLAFKVGAVPFHWWVADAYEGASSPITGFMASGVKVAAFALLARLLGSTIGIPEATRFWGPVLVVLSILTMGLGSFLAIVQTNLKRLLAYSSIVHTGYALLALVAAGHPGADAAGALSSLALYLVVYSTMTLGAFAAIAALERDGRERERIEDYRGLAQRRPGVALALSLSLFSLAGLPPTAGFVGKFQVFRAAVDAQHAWLALLGVVASLVSLYYYLRVVMVLYVEDPAEDFPADFDPWGVRAALIASAAGVLLFGILPGRVVEAALDGARSLFVGFAN